jgi:glutamate dehydrogenase (NADP+)
MFGQYKRLVNRFEGVLTGKGLSYGGSLIRPEATGYGVVYFMEDMLAHRGEHIAGRTCAVSGSGNVAQYTVEKINDLGGKVVTLSDSSGFIYDKEGIDANRLAWLLDLKNNRRGRIEEYAKEFKCEFHAGKRPWGVPVDLAFPCATQNELDEEDAKTLINNGVKAVSEGANMPTLPGAVEAFLHAGIPNAPSKASNAGGVATSGLEMSQNSLRISWSREEVDARLREIMRNIHAQCVEYGTTGGKTDYYSGANVAGFMKVANAMLAQGVM